MTVNRRRRNTAAARSARRKRARNASDAPARRRFHEYEMRRWIGRKPYQSLFKALRVGGDAGAGSPQWEEFLARVTGGYATRRAVFDPPIERLMSQVQAATNMALDFPDRYPNFYEFLTADAARKVGTPGTATQAPLSDAELWRKAAGDLLNSSTCSCACAARPRGGPRAPISLRWSGLLQILGRRVRSYTPRQRLYMRPA